jgi:hypothetical protein
MSVTCGRSLIFSGFHHQRVMWSIVIIWHLSFSSINSYIFIFFSKTGPIVIKLGRNVHLMVLLKVNGFFCWSEVLEKQVAQRCQKRGWVVCFKSCLKPLGQLKPSLVGMFIEWFYKTFMFFLLIGSTRKTSAQRFQKGGCLFLYVECLFFNQSWWVFFFMFLIKFIFI